MASAPTGAPVACFIHRSGVTLPIFETVLNAITLVGSIVLRVDDLQRQTEFWEAALGYVRRDSGESDDFVLLAIPSILAGAYAGFGPDHALLESFLPSWGL